MTNTPSARQIAQFGGCSGQTHRCPLGGRNKNVYEHDVIERRDAKILKHQEGKRPSTRDRKLAQLQRDNHRCRACGKPVTHQTSHLDHIKPVNQFASFEASNAEGNLQTLCWECHHCKTHGHVRTTNE